VAAVVRLNFRWYFYLSFVHPAAAKEVNSMLQSLSQKLYARLATLSLAREEGQTMAEYGVVLALITVGTVAAIGALALAITGKLGAVTGILTSAVPG
jgi:Flp pilus assembly pilin Flp